MPTVFGLMYDYVCSKHKAYAKATRTTAEGAEGDPGIGQPTRRCSPSRPPIYLHRKICTCSNRDLRCRVTSLIKRLIGDPVPVN